MLIKHLQLFKVHVAFLELNALLCLLFHQSLSLTSNFDLSVALILYLVQLTPYSRVFGSDAVLDASDRLLLLLLLALQNFGLLCIILFKPDRYLPLLFFVLVEGLSTRRQFFKQLALAFLLHLRLLFFENGSLSPDTLLDCACFLADSHVVQLCLLTFGLDSSFERL